MPPGVERVVAVIGDREHVGRHARALARVWYGRTRRARSRTARTHMSRADGCRSRSLHARSGGWQYLSPRAPQESISSDLYRINNSISNDSYRINNSISNDPYRINNSL